MLPSTRPQRAAVLRDGEDFRIFSGEPRWRRGGGGGKIDGDTIFVEQVDHFVQPIEVPGVPFWLQSCPREDRKGHHIDAGFAHEPHVLVPCFPRPLLGVVIGTESHPGA